MTEKVEKVARAMALANGFDPDERVIDTWSFTGLGTAYYVPQWRRYERDAKSLIAGLTALQE